jgi:hypothetical protein
MKKIIFSFLIIAISFTWHPVLADELRVPAIRHPFIELGDNDTSIDRKGCEPLPWPIGPNHPRTPRPKPMPFPQPPLPRPLRLPPTQAQTESASSSEGCATQVHTTQSDPKLAEEF